MTARTLVPVSPEPSPAAAGDAPQGDDLLAVIAHSLLGSISVVVGGTELLASHWRSLEAAERDDLLQTMRGQARHVAAVLDNLVRLGDPHLIQVLDELQHDDGETPHPPPA